MSDAPLKSAYELAMERLQAEDRESGKEQAAPLTEEQKSSIADLRQQAQAKRAEAEILHQKDLAAATAVGDPEKLTQTEEHYETDLRRVESALDSAIARVRAGEQVESI